jgi:acyl-CoA thioesterase
MRFLTGGIPREWNGQDVGESLSRLWVRDEPPRPLDFPALTALADVFFPRLWLRRAKLTPLGTVSMTVYFHADGEQLRETGTGHLLLQARGQGFGGGYFDHAGQLWNEAGELLATTHQVVYYKE